MSNQVQEAEEGRERQGRRGLMGALVIDHTPLAAPRDYRLLFIGPFVSAFGAPVGSFVLPWPMFRLTRSTFAVGMLGVVEFVPMLVIALIGGALADYIDRRRLVVLAESGMMIACVILALNATLAAPRIWVLFLVAALTAALNAMH